VLCAIAIVSFGLMAHVARAQQAPQGPGGGAPPGPVPGGAGPATGPVATPGGVPQAPASVAAGVRADLDAAGVAVAREAAALIALRGFGSPSPPRLAQAVAPVSDGEQGVAALDAADTDGARLLVTLSSDGLQLPPKRPRLSRD
jgi:hypothetical protein